jgi:hypothetical protein
VFRKVDTFWTYQGAGGRAGDARGRARGESPVPAGEREAGCAWGAWQLGGGKELGAGIGEGVADAGLNPIRVFAVRRSLPCGKEALPCTLS